MKAEILKFPEQVEELLRLVGRTRKELVIAVPFYEKYAVDEILNRLPKFVKLRALIRANIKSDFDALRSLCERGEVRAIPNLHAKILIFDKSAAIISSLNLDRSWERSTDIGVLLRGRSVKELITWVNEWWGEYGEKVTPRKIDRYEKEQKRGKVHPLPPDAEASPSLGKRIPVQAFQWSRFEREHLLINVAWSPRRFKEACQLDERPSDPQKICCIKCRDEEWEDGCLSSTLFRDYDYYTFKKYIRRGNLAFFVTKHPDLDKYIIVGFLYMNGKKGRRTPRHVKKFYRFGAIREKSIRFPLDKRRAIVFDRKFTEKLPSLGIRWEIGGRPIKKYSETGWIGRQTQNQKKISNFDAITILEKYYRKSRDGKALKIIEELKAGVSI